MMEVRNEEGRSLLMVRIMECSICSRLKRENLVLLGRNICGECERQMVRSTAEDLLYPLYMEKIKEIMKTGELQQENTDKN
jgi:hypothetical protein